MDGLSFEQIAEMAASGDASGLSALYQGRNIFGRMRLSYDVGRLQKAINRNYATLQAAKVRAANQGAVVNDAFWLAGGVYENGAKEKPNVTFDKLREFAHGCEPANAIIEKRTTQVSDFGQIAKNKHGQVSTPGFRVVMSDEAGEATEKDKANMSALNHFLLECGYCPPPFAERPTGWQPGFHNFLSQLTRDSLTLDWAAVRFWASEDDPTRPIACFACEDAATIRIMPPKYDGVKHGIPIYSDPDHTRVNTRQRIAYIKVPPGTSMTGQASAEFTVNELRPFVRNSRTDETGNGYGYSELERCINAMTQWIWARNYNASRFRDDALPRGILVLLGQGKGQMLEAFKVEWTAMLKGNRFKTPIISADKDSEGARWIDIDKAPRDMEHQMLMFTLAVWMHAVYQIHPEETGYHALTPLRPPLSEASPQAKLEYSQDSGLTPLLKKIANFINREIIWKLVPDKRYVFEFAGIGQTDMLQEAAAAGQRLQAGISNTRIEWARQDQPIPDIIKDHPALDIPGPFLQAAQYLLALQQAELAAQQAQQAQQQMMMAQQQQQGGMGAPGSAQRQQMGGMPPGQQQFGQPQQQPQVGGGGMPSDTEPGQGEEMPSASLGKAVVILRSNSLNRWN